MRTVAADLSIVVVHNHACTHSTAADIHPLLHVCTLASAAFPIDKYKLR